MRAELVAEREEIDLLLEEQMKSAVYEIAVEAERLDDLLGVKNQRVMAMEREVQRLELARAQVSGNVFLLAEWSSQLGQANQRLCSEQKQLKGLVGEREAIARAFKAVIAGETELAFREYLAKEAVTFMKLREFYGEEVYFQIASEHRRQLESLISS